MLSPMHSSHLSPVPRIGISQVLDFEPLEWGGSPTKGAGVKCMLERAVSQRRVWGLGVDDAQLMVTLTYSIAIMTWFASRKLFIRRHNCDHRTSGMGKLRRAIEHDGAESSNPTLLLLATGRFNLHNMCDGKSVGTHHRKYRSPPCHIRRCCC